MSQASGRPDNRTIVAIVLVVVLVVFALLNLEPVQISFLIFKLEIPLFIVLVIMSAIGFVAGWLAAGRRKA